MEPVKHKLKGHYDITYGRQLDITNDVWKEVDHEVNKDTYWVIHSNIRGFIWMRLNQLSRR